MKKWILIAVVAVVGIFLGKRFLFPNEMEKVRAQLKAIAASATLGEKDSVIERLATVKKTSNYLTDDFKVVTKRKSGTSHTLQGKSEIVQAMTAGQLFLSSLSVSFVDETIVVESDQARVTLTVKAVGRAREGNEEFFYPVEASLVLKKVDGDWRLQSAEQVTPITP